MQKNNAYKLDRFEMHDTGFVRAVVAILYNVPHNVECDIFNS